jgi:hypothetical protein
MYPSTSDQLRVGGQPAVVTTGTGERRRWWLAQPSLAGLLTAGPYRSAGEAHAALGTGVRLAWSR